MPGSVVDALLVLTVDFLHCCQAHSFSDKAPRPPQKGFYCPWGPLGKHCYIGWESESCSTASWEGPVVSLDRVMILVKERSGFWIHSVIYLCLCGTRDCSEHAVFKQGSKERSCLWHWAQGPKRLHVWPLTGTQGPVGWRGLSCPPCLPQEGNITPSFF